MPNKRISQVNELVRNELAVIITREIEFPDGCLVTIKKVETSADLHQAKVWLSVLPIDYRQKVLKIMRKNIYSLQKILDRKLVMKYVPKLYFLIDVSEEEAEKLEGLLDKIKETS